MGEQSGARIGGDDYQHLYSWYLLLKLLPEDCAYEHAYVEHPKAGAADDVTLHPKSVKVIPSQYYQVKFHVSAAAQYDFEILATVKKPNTTSLIQKLFQSWKSLKKDGPTEIWLVSNWPAAIDFGKFIHEDHGFNDLFHGCGKRSKPGKARSSWQKHLNSTENEMADFCRDLRLRLGFAGTRDLEEMVDDRMSNNGLKSGPKARAIVMAAIRNIIKEGGAKKKITRESLIELVTENGLWAEAKDNPKARLEIHGWVKRKFDGTPTVELDWTEYIDRDTRRIPDQSEWQEKLLPQLIKARKTFQHMPDGHYIDFRGKLPLTTVLAVGAAFPEVAGFAFRAEQPTDSEINLWRSDSPPSHLIFDRTLHADNEKGDDILIALSISGCGLHDAENYFKEHRDTFSALIYAEPTTGTGSSAIQNAGDAVALANDAKKIIREYRELYRAKNTHVILFAPAGFCLFLGQKLNALGQIVAYERTANGSYQAAVKIATG